jgi:hypothetical protein
MLVEMMGNPVGDVTVIAKVLFVSVVVPSLTLKPNLSQLVAELS